MSQSHMVIFQTPDGSPGYNQFDSVEAAVSFVEKLRNDQGIENARMFALEEIKFELKPYFKVELQALNPGSTSAPGPGPSPAAGSPGSISTGPGAAPSPAPAPAPTSAETTSFGSPGPSSEPAPSPAPAPAPSQEAPSSEQPTRRGLFGR